MGSHARRLATRPTRRSILGVVDTSPLATNAKAVSAQLAIPREIRTNVRRRVLLVHQSILRQASVRRRMQQHVKVVEARSLQEPKEEAEEDVSHARRLATRPTRRSILGVVDMSPLATNAKAVSAQLAIPR